MGSKRILAIVASGGMLLTAAAAHAGGFARGSADTDILFEQSNFDVRAGITHVVPTRKFSANRDPALVGQSYTSSYTVPSVALKARLADQLACAGTYVQAYGGDTNYEGRTTAGKLVENMSIDEYALTCSVNFQMGNGKLHLLGGGFVEKFNYNRTQLADIAAMVSSPVPVLVGAGLGLNGTDYGYRLGVAYEIPEIAFRTQLMYRSGTSYGATGNFTLGLPALAGGPQTVAATGAGNLPQSVELKVQSGIAPGWLAFGSVKWTDWSVQRALVVSSSLTGPVPDTYNWKDGWTISGGVGHAFNERVSGLAAITWDQGVGTGWDLSSDTWTFALGGSIKDNIGGEFRGGLGITYLTSASETQYGPGANNAVDAGWAYAFNLGYKLGF